jgi:hypothetical protein
MKIERPVWSSGGGYEVAMRMLSAVVFVPVTGLPIWKCVSVASAQYLTHALSPCGEEEEVEEVGAEMNGVVACASRKKRSKSVIEVRKRDGVLAFHLRTSTFQTASSQLPSFYPHHQLLLLTTAPLWTNFSPSSSAPYSLTMVQPADVAKHDAKPHVYIPGRGGSLLPN